ncbi:MAG: DNA topoisomerase 4 subunit A [Clostridia bacterium]|nr:DNA topoisomerase 4 subunit A [Clostridia bacterium]
MPKKRSPEKPIAKDDPSRIIVTSMEDVMHNSMIPYAEHVILERALPRVEDGLKPVQRRILYTMMELGTTPDKPHRKCARIVGDCLGKYHPHGDSSVYDALVRMAQDFSMRGPMVDGHGNFGSIDGDGAAAMRYTEARMAPLAMQMLRDIEKDTVPFRLNFDDTLKEPDMLPARFPNLLVNGASGIAVGLATNIPPHNIGESIRAAIAQIENPDISLDELMAILPGPDFPTGGVLVQSEEIRQGYLTGRSKLQLRARVHVEDGAAGRKLLVITEIPYGVNKAAMLEKIQRLVDEKKPALAGVYDVRDESDREGLRGIVELRRDTDPDKVLAYLYKYSDLQITFGVNMVAIADGKPVQMGLKAMLGYFIDHQKRVVTRRTEYELKQAEARAHILEGLMVAVDNLDEVIRLIRASKNPKEARIALMEAFALDEAQAQAILDMRLQRLTNLEILALRKEYEDLQKLIRNLKAILGSEKKLLSLIAKELHEIEAEFADERRTTIEAIEEVQLDKADTAPVPDEAVVAFTGAGQFKRVWPAALKKTPFPTPAEDPKEAPRFLFSTKTDETLYIFTSLGNCYPLAVSALNECKPKDRGQLPAGLLPKLEDGEEVVWIDCCVSEALAKRPALLLVTDGGMAKRMEATELDVRSKRFTVMGLKGDDRLACVAAMPGEDDILLITRLGMGIRFAPDTVPVQGRTSGGVRGIGLTPEDRVMLAAPLRKGDELLLISDRGNGKRIPAMGFERQGRGGKGVRAFPFAKNGANGARLAAAILTDGQPAQLVILQAQSAPTLMDSAAVPLQPVSGKGSPLVLAILTDVVTDARLSPLHPNTNMVE